MIVKNESTVIARSFDSVKDFVDYFCICDTGSSDGTQDTIRKYLSDNNLSGEVYDTKWVDFGHNRTEAFNLASGTSDYIMTLDADEVFIPYVGNKVVKSGKISTLPELKSDSIKVKTVWNGGYEYFRLQFFKDGLDWRWEQPVHEYCWSPKSKTKDTLDDVCVVPTPDGARSRDPHKYKKDAIIFETYLLDHPEDSRSWFYLAQSYRDCGNLKRALEALEKVLELGGWDEEIFEAKLRKARFIAALEGMDKAIPHYLEAFNTRSSRAEPLYELLAYFRMMDKFEVGILLGETANSIPYPKDQLFISRAVYEWKIKDELSICYYWVGKYKESLNLTQQILDEKSALIDDEALERIKRNHQFSKDKLYAPPEPEGPVGPR